MPFNNVDRLLGALHESGILLLNTVTCNRISPFLPPLDRHVASLCLPNFDLMYIAKGTVHMEGQLQNSFSHGCSLSNNLARKYPHITQQKCKKVMELACKQLRSSAKRNDLPPTFHRTLSPSLPIKRDHRQRTYAINSTVEIYRYDYLSMHSFFFFRPIHFHYQPVIMPHFVGHPLLTNQILSKGSLFAIKYTLQGLMIKPCTNMIFN